MRKIQFSFGDSVFETLTELKQMTGSSSLAEVVRDSVLFFFTVLKKNQEGYEIHLKKGNENYLVMLSLPSSPEKKT